ncbi:MAG: BON domain-containing protein [Vicinamibacteria bacterium]
MTRLSSSHAFAIACLLSGGAALANAQSPTPSPSLAPDNTGVNKRDTKASEPTADQQHNDDSDLEITQQIRTSIMADKSLSTYAHNVKVISQNGMVTLKGPVRSRAEKSSVEAKAAEIVGQGKVTSELAVARKQ